MIALLKPITNSSSFFVEAYLVLGEKKNIAEMIAKQREIGAFCNRETAVAVPCRLNAFFNRPRMSASIKEYLFEHKPPALQLNPFLYSTLLEISSCICNFSRSGSRENLEDL